MTESEEIYFLESPRVAVPDWVKNPEHLLAADYQPQVGISGRYKHFKPQVDRVIRQFRELGADVIQPEEGDILLPTLSPGFYPINEEKYRTETEVKMRFLMKMREENIHCIANFDGTIGPSVGMETGFAWGLQSVDPTFLLFALRKIYIEEPDWADGIRSFAQIPVMSPEEAMSEWRKGVLRWIEKRAQPKSPLLVAQQFISDRFLP